MSNSNPGLAPVDATTPVGLVRALVGDTQSTPFNPVIAGQENYDHFSDAEITAFLTQGNQNTAMAVGFAYLSLAAAAALVGRLSATDDLKLDTTKRAADLRLLADEWFNRANAVEGIALVATGVTVEDWRELIYPSGNVILSDYYLGLTV